MLSRKWRLVVFATVFLFVPSRRCAAGPIRRNMCMPEFYFPKDLFSRSAPIPTSPTTIFHMDGDLLTHIVVPPEFRIRDSRTANATAAMQQVLGWDADVPQFSPPGYHLPSTL